MFSMNTYIFLKCHQIVNVPLCIFSTYYFVNGFHIIYSSSSMILIFGSNIWRGHGAPWRSDGSTDPLLCCPHFCLSTRWVCRIPKHTPATLPGRNAGPGLPVLRMFPNLEIRFSYGIFWFLKIVHYLEILKIKTKQKHQGNQTCQRPQPVLRQLVYNLWAKPRSWVFGLMVRPNSCFQPRLNLLTQPNLSLQTPLPHLSTRLFHTWNACPAPHPCRWHCPNSTRIFPGFTALLIGHLPRSLCS